MDNAELLYTPPPHTAIGNFRYFQILFQLNNGKHKVLSVVVCTVVVDNKVWMSEKRNDELVDLLIVFLVYEVEYVVAWDSRFIK